MILAFKVSVNGVLLACAKLKEKPEAELLFANNKHEIKQKLKFSNVRDEVIYLGFDRQRATSGLITEILGKRPARMSRTDPAPIKYIDLILRNRDANPAELVRLLVSCCGKMEMLYSKKTQLARRYYRYMRDVSASWQRLCMLARPCFINGILTVRIDSQHDVGDIFCRWLAKKNPDVPVAVIHGKDAWVGNGKLVGLGGFIKTTAKFVDNLKGPEQDTGIETDIEVEELWDIFYDSQMIETRRNRTLAKKMQPKGVSDLYGMTKKDRYKVEHGIANCTLDRFIQEQNPR